MDSLRSKAACCSKGGHVVMSTWVKACKLFADVTVESRCGSLSTRVAHFRQAKDIRMFYSAGLLKVSGAIYGLCIMADNRYHGWSSGHVQYVYEPQLQSSGFG